MIVMIMTVKRVKERLYDREPENERQTRKERDRQREKILSRIKRKMLALVELTHQWERQLINTSK